MVRVYHEAEPSFGILPSVFPAGYIEVAMVDTDELEAAYVATNHIDEAWQHNENVTALRTGQAERSTSIGDVLVRDNVAFRVGSCAVYQELGHVASISVVPEEYRPQVGD